jgi:hypothetical protein
MRIINVPGRSDIIAIDTGYRFGTFKPCFREDDPIIAHRDELQAIVDEFRRLHQPGLNAIYLTPPVEYYLLNDIDVARITLAVGRFIIVVFDHELDANTLTWAKLQAEITVMKWLVGLARQGRIRFSGIMPRTPSRPAGTARRSSDETDFAGHLSTGLDLAQLIAAIFGGS